MQDGDSMMVRITVANVVACLMDLQFLRDYGRLTPDEHKEVVGIMARIGAEMTGQSISIPKELLELHGKAGELMEILKQRGITRKPG